ncbi:ABC transporter ATP-binding protein [Ornithinimicrobium ciconiae]|uniref:ABC-type quaternary amine transporter n=1 Tax=Ornithinimicrobium ciconiae TaxID=2594265 RepID=A0A516GFI7_9MICO|nr:ABC transporter ATP-binding protein [Ornithinimicrobium ciconiae]QDO90100.1 ABC transporter ATP-binding protein [Ornithinimicrobium ciconiae]
MLSVDAVTVRFGDTVAVDAASLDLRHGQVLAVLGPSGCGKSTLLRAIAGLEELAAGSVRAEGRDLRDVPTHRRGFALMFQDGQLFRHLDVAGNVGYPLRLPRHGGSVREPLSQPAREPLSQPARADRVQELLETVGLPGYGSREVSTLSGGEQQRVALARALAAEPRLLLLDEPLSALDRSLRERLAGDLRGILTATGTTALLVTHDHDEAFTLADRMALMFDGRIAQEGPTEEVWAAPATREVAEFIGFGTFLEAEPARRVMAAAAQASNATPMRPDVRDVSARTSHGAHLVASGSGSSPTVGHDGALLPGDERVLALRRSALRVDPAGSLEGTVVAAGAVSDAVRVELDLDGIGAVEALGDQGSTLRPGDRVRVRADGAGMALLP